MTFWRKDKTEAETFSASPEEFKGCFRLWPTGVSVVTTRDGEGLAYGVTMNSVTSVSLEPPLLLMCLRNDSETLAAMRASGIFCVNFLASGQEEISNRFAHRRPDKFKDLPTHDGRLGAPVLEGVLAALECRVEEVYPGGDHQIVLGELVHGTRYNPDAAPLVYFNGQYAKPHL
jgi:flavin reductase (DIM6/NTAB) family NADH-FMN oxidoreductase RutF